LPQVVSEPIFGIPGLVEAASHQCFNPILGGGSPEWSDARIPPGTELDVRREDVLTRRLVLAIAQLSNPAIRVASVQQTLKKATDAGALALVQPFKSGGKIA
jgi:hypothetical protein